MDAILTLIAPFFRDLYETTGINFNVFYDPYQFKRFLIGAENSILLILAAILLSVIVGVAGAAIQQSRSTWLRWLVGGYIQLFRNTPPMVQLLFFYFGLGAYAPQVDMGGYYQPMVSAFGWAVIALGIFGGAFNVEIFRSGIEAVPKATLEAAESLGFKPWQTFVYFTLPLAFRICLPALTTNLVSLAKTTSLAYVISVPEMANMLNQVWSSTFNIPEMMAVLFCFYVGVVWLLAAFLHWLERRLRLRGYSK
ncbi:amino acid ABC transporter permease [Alloyangia pacifica]|uniref:Polar amino acid transport system permease protein n=1 Tax=Alloyangia pacifica TaxID=311180 RepID=A0A1I6UWZ6_9RHOB|nr:amino acid ABC transporter permease [Alloyangia pacifica]SDI29233.1 polar amino acid transport system permease protein [Alloyangia pacifica]SFT06001.1 polar amino acid transport system permease protein [Alloyangia pacifica]